MKTPLAQGCREHSRHAPMAVPQQLRGTRQHRWGMGMAQRIRGRGIVRGALEGTGFPAAALLPVAGPTPDTAEKGACLAAVVLRAMAWPRSARGDDGPCARAARAPAPGALPRVPGQACPMAAAAEGSVGGCRGTETPGERTIWREGQQCTGACQGSPQMCKLAPPAVWDKAPVQESSGPVKGLEPLAGVSATW